MNWDNIIKKHWQLILFNVLTLLIFAVFYGHFGHIIIDSFREAYIPVQMLKGQVLYKDIFCVYPPLAYIINAFLMLIFGTKLRVLYFAGLLATLGILNSLYRISNKFLPKTYSLSIVMLTIAASVLSPNVFNFIFPYSYGIIYGILFVLLSVYFALKGKSKLAYIFYALAICSKYEFIFLLPILFWYSGKKEFLKSILNIIATIFIVFLPLLVMGLRVNDLSNICQTILTMSSTKTLYWFYSISGLTFRLELIPIYGINFLKCFIPLAFLYFFRHWLVTLLILVYFCFTISPAIFVYIFPLLLILLIFSYKNLNLNKKFLVFSTLAISLKLFFALTLLSYGVYFLPLAVLSLFIVIPRRYKKSLLIIVFIMSFTFSAKNIISLSEKNIKIETENGIVYSNDYYGNSIKELISYINDNTRDNDKILVLPETTAINFLTKRSSDNKFYSLIPLYIETFGEENIIERLYNNKPKYIVISNYDTSNYYYSYFGQDYAQQIYDYILTNYAPIKQVGKGFVFIVFKLKQAM